MIVKDDGVISLVIPDKRYCFDHYRPITGIAAVIDRHLQDNRIPSAGMVAEHFLSAVTKDGHIAWDRSVRGPYACIHDTEEVLQRMHGVRDKKEYTDVHAWCFVPHSFRLLMQDLYALGFIPFREVSFYPTEGCEFFVTISRSGKGIAASRLEIARKIESEIKNDESPYSARLQNLRQRIRSWLKRTQA